MKDVSLQDFADNARSTQRLSKSQLTSKAKIKEAPKVLEKGPDFEEESEEEEDQVSELEEVTMTSQPEVTGSQTDDRLPVRHPPELWGLVANYILPEDISRFGAICQDAYAVVNSPSFWLKLYKDFYPIDRHEVRIDGNQVRYRSLKENSILRPAQG